MSLAICQDLNIGQAFLQGPARKAIQELTTQKLELDAPLGDSVALS